MHRRKTNPDYLNGVPELLILQLLARRPMHGYELVQTIKLASRGALEFGEGCIYPLLHRLEGDALLSSRRVLAGGRSRSVYQATRKVKKRLAASRKSWEHTMEAIAGILQGGEHGTPELA